MRICCCRVSRLRSALGILKLFFPRLDLLFQCLLAGQQLLEFFLRVRSRTDAKGLSITFVVRRCCRARRRKRAFSLRSCSFSWTTGSRRRPFGPRGLASAFNEPARRARRHSARCEEYRPSRPYRTLPSPVLRANSDRFTAPQVDEDVEVGIHASEAST